MKFCEVAFAEWLASFAQSDDFSIEYGCVNTLFWNNRFLGITWLGLSDKLPPHICYGVI